MIIQPSISSVWTIFYIFVLFSSATSFDRSVYYDDLSVIHTYDRVADIEKECRPFLSSASELKPDDSRRSRLKHELSFYDGDWEHEIGDAPLMSFDDSDLPKHSSITISPLKLVGFEVKDVNPVHELKNAISLRGTMCIGIARDSTNIYNARSNFYTRPGLSFLRITFEGVYIETKGKRLLCMLGNTTLPSRNWIHNPSNTINGVNSFSNFQAHLLPDDRVMMVLHYPQVFSLTNRVIRGEIRSLNERGSSKYFDVVRISSLLGPYSKYHFSSEKLEPRTCDQSLYQDEVAEYGINFFNNSEFCKSLELFSGQAFNVMPNWRFTGKDEYGDRMGPFLLGQEIKGVDGNYGDIKLTIQHLICEQETTHNLTKSMRVAAVISTFPATMEKNPAAMRAGVSKMMLSVEGTWDPSTGQLCMVGCLILADSGLGGCDSQVSLYFPCTLSIKQRGAILGSISSIKSEIDWYVPISFLFEIHSLEGFDNYEKYVISHQTYNYTMTAMANAIRNQSQPSNLSIAAKPLFLTYPALGDKEDLFTSLDHLSRALCFHAYAVSETSFDRIKPETFINVKVLSLGPLVGHYVPDFCDINCRMKHQAQASKSEVLNVSLSLSFTEAHFKSTEKYYKNISSLFLEGVYDPLSGEMYLIGCRKLMAETESYTTERGLDCLIQVKIQYSAETMRWLINPTTKITIISQRNEDDPLYFRPIDLQTFMIMYNNHDDALFRKAFEENLRILILLFSIIFFSSQLLYLRKNEDVTLYVSRTTLALQQVVYGLPLFTNMKLAFEPKEDMIRFLEFDQYKSILNCTQILLAAAAFLLIVRLSKEVLDSRNLSHVDSTSKSKRVPYEKKIMFITAVIHLFGYVSYCEHQRELLNYKAVDIAGHLNFMGVWTYKQREYIGIIQDTFLIPQIICNLIWKPPGKPLRKLYYIGFTLMRILIHLYDYIRDPVIHPYSDGTLVNGRSVFTSRTDKIAITVIVSVLAIIVYVQQKVNHQKVSRFPLLSSKSM